MSDEKTERRLQDNLTAGDTWLRGLFMLLFAIIWSVAEAVLLVVAILQFGFVLFTREKSGQLLSFGADMAEFMRAVVRFVTFNSDDKPFPFAPWPGAKRATEPAQHQSA